MSAEKLGRYAEDVRVDGHIARFRVPREGLTETLGRILSELDVVDLAVTDPPVEEIIGLVFRRGIEP